ncbi:delta(8)-fatty-acid desaturase [Quercus suber]|uniref:Delta(8)-fatty-acid desaturase n=1 Tax=Quercus suber TaxID=58331 RepID=A0AAW0IE20_QUESU
MAESRRHISQEELGKHNKRGDLWVSIQGKIYDVSDWAKDHPGGEPPLLNLSGQDATDAFVAYHPGTAYQYLDKFFTGYYLQDYSVSEVSKDYRKLVSEFTQMGLFDKKGHVTLYTLTAIALLFVVSVYGILCSDSMWVHLGCGALMGVLWIQSGWIGHDSGHYKVMSSTGFNRFAQVLSGNCLAGISIAWWKWNHNAHHIACNSLDFDPDLQHMPFFVVSSKFFNSLTSYFYDRKLNFDSASRFLFCLNHFSSNVYVGHPSGNEWCDKQTKGTLDITCPSWMDWFHGGLQFQIEHHLFPRLPRCQLRKVSPMVQELCKKHNLPYNSASFWKANEMTIGTLRTAALQARDLANPVPKNMVWEAFNTHG